MAISITTYAPAHFDGVETLWRTVFPDDPHWNAAATAIPAKLAVQPELFLAALDASGVGPPRLSAFDGAGLTPPKQSVVGSLMAGYDGHRGWLYALAVHPEQRRRGIAKALVEEAVVRLQRLGCGKVNLQVRSGNDAATAFWRSMGFSVEDRVSMGRRL